MTESPVISLKPSESREGWWLPAEEQQFVRLTPAPPCIITTQAEVGSAAQVATARGVHCPPSCPQQQVLHASPQREIASTGQPMDSHQQPGRGRKLQATLLISIGSLGFRERWLGGIQHLICCLHILHYHSVYFFHLHLPLSQTDPNFS